MIRHRVSSQNGRGGYACSCAACALACRCGMGAEAGRAAGGRGRRKKVRGKTLAMLGKYLGGRSWDAWSLTQLRSGPAVEKLGRAVCASGEEAYIGPLYALQ